MRDSAEGLDTAGESLESSECIDEFGEAMLGVPGLESSSVVDSFVDFCFGRNRLDIPDTMIPGCRPRNGASKLTVPRIR